MYIEKAIESKRYIRRYLATLEPDESNKSQVSYIEESARREAVLADGYQLCYCNDDDFVYCLALGQTLEERKTQAALVILDPRLSLIRDTTQ